MSPVSWCERRCIEFFWDGYPTSGAHPIWTSLSGGGVVPSVSLRRAAGDREGQEAKSAEEPRLLETL